MRVNASEYPEARMVDHECDAEFDTDGTMTEGVWFCTRVADHEGPHAAHGLGLIAVDGLPFPLEVKA